MQYYKKFKTLNILLKVNKNKHEIKVVNNYSSTTFYKLNVLF